MRSIDLSGWLRNRAQDYVSAVDGQAVGELVTQVKAAMNRDAPATKPRVPRDVAHTLTIRPWERKLGTSRRICQRTGQDRQLQRHGERPRKELRRPQVIVRRSCD